MQTTKRAKLFSAKEGGTVAQGTMIKGLCGSVSEVKNVPVTIPAENSDDTDVFSFQSPQRNYLSMPALTIILSA